jgi:NitT/TauT family transport system ATP-binding protein
VSLDVAAAPFLTIHQLWKSYGDRVVLEGINKKINQGEFVTLVGASGCGKTTFLKMLLGTEAASKGRIELQGVALKAEPDASRGIVFQRYSVFGHLSVIDNLVIAREFEQSIFLSRLFGHKKKQVMTEAMDMLHAVGLSQVAHAYPHELSGGMQQRLALAQALMKNPSILLLDEPFGALDPGIRTDMHNLVKDLWQTRKLTIFMITHDIKEAFVLGTRLWVFDKLRLDPHAPHRYGSTITYDIDISKNKILPDQYIPMMR